MNASAAGPVAVRVSPADRLLQDAAGVERNRIEEALTRLARAVHQFHVYPTASPTCVEAIRACRRALLALDSESLACTVGTNAILVDGNAIGMDGPIGRELANRLWAVNVTGLEIRRNATARCLTRFCEDLIAEQSQEGSCGLHRRLVNHDVDGVSVREAVRPQVLDVHSTVPLRQLAEHQRRWRARQEKRSRSAHLFPPERGWARIDPGVDVQPLSLHEMALLVDDPAVFASMLERLAGREDSDGDAGDALVGHCGQIARILEALEPSLATRAFDRLGQAVLALDTKRRTRLLTNTVLPGLLEGRAEGALLRALPDVDLADGLALILDADAAAPQLLSAALERLNLPAERLETVAPRLREHIRRHAARTGTRDTALEERTQRLIRVASGEAKSFRQFLGIDVAMDPNTIAVLASTQADIDATDTPIVRLRCAVGLLCQNRNADAMKPLMRNVAPQLTALVREARWCDVAPALAALSAHAQNVCEVEPEAAALVQAELESVVGADSIESLAKFCESARDGRTVLQEIVGALGSSLARPAVEGLARAAGPESRRRIAALLGAHSSRFEPVLTVLLPGLPTAAAVAVVRALGRAGCGGEPLVAQQLSQRDELIVREALKALTEIGSPAALQAVLHHLRSPGAPGLTTAEASLWAFRADLCRAGVDELLRHRRFVTRHPDLTLRILDRLARVGTAGVEQALAHLSPLRLRLWSPRLARIGRRARSLLDSPR